VVAVGIKVRTCDKGSIGERTSCLRFASRAGLGPLLGGEVVLELVLLCCRPGDMALTWCVRRPLHGLSAHDGTWEKHAGFCSPASPRDKHKEIKWDHLPSSFPVLEAVPGRPELLSNSKLVLLSVPTSGLMASEMSAASLSGPFSVSVGNWVSSAIVRPQEQATRRQRHCRADVAFDRELTGRIGWAARRVEARKCGLPVELAF